MAANRDYSKSAENLCNPKELSDKLAAYHEAQSIRERVMVRLEQTPDWQALRAQDKALTIIEQDIRDAIDKSGGYQDLEKGHYALKYRRVSKSYKAEQFKAGFPKFAPAVIVESINVKALEGLLKGGLITEEQLQQWRVVEESVTYAYLVK